MKNGRFNPLVHRQQAWVYVVGALFVADFIFYGYLPSHRRLQALEQARTQKKQLIETAQAQSRALPDLQKDLSSMEKRVLHYEGKIPTDNVLGPFLSQIADIMTRHSLSDQVMEPRKTIETGNLSYIPIRMNCRGTLEAVFGFCNDLQDLDRLVRIEKVTLENDSDFTGWVTLEADVAIFYRSEGRKDLAGAMSQGAMRNDT